MKKHLEQLGKLLLVLAISAALLPMDTYAAYIQHTDNGPATNATQLLDPAQGESPAGHEKDKKLTNTGFLEDLVDRSYSLEDLFSGRFPENEAEAAFHADSEQTYMASCFPQISAINTHYGLQLNNPERYLYQQLVSFYAAATAQRGINGETDFEVGPGYPFENLSEPQFEALYETCSNEIFVYWGTALQAFLQDYPQYDADKIRYYGACFLICQDEETGLITGSITARIRFYYDGLTTDIYDRYNALQNVKNSASFQGTRFEKIRAIHDYVCERTTYSFSGSSIYSAYGALVDKKAVCQGYALAFKLLCDKEGIPCQAIAGSANGISHMWNAVQMENGSWYAVDTTWDDQQDCIHYDHCLVGKNSIPIHSDGSSFARSHTADMRFSHGDHADSLSAPALNDTVYSGVPFNDDEGDFQITLQPDTFAYTGQECVPDVTVRSNGRKLEKDVDYTVTYQDNKNAGTAKVRLTGTGSYMGDMTRTFSIKKPISDCQIIIDPQSITYADPIQMPSVTVKDGDRTLAEGVDYTAIYPDVVEEGTAYIIINGEGSYTGSESRPFTVQPIKKDIRTCAFTGIPDSLTYTGKDLKPAITVEDGDRILDPGTDYEIKYQNNRNAGKASVIFTGIGSYTGTMTKTFQIAKAAQKINCPTTSYSRIYGSGPFFLDAKAIAGGGKLKYQSSDLGVAYVWNNGKVSIRGMGIVTITVSAMATRNYNASDPKTITIEISPKKQVITQLRTKGSGKLSVKWRPDNAASGYMIKCALTANFAKSKGLQAFKINGTRATSKTISKLKKGKWYYVTVCSYKNVKKKGKVQPLCGKWSKVQKIKIK